MIEEIIKKFFGSDKNKYSLGNKIYRLKKLDNDYNNLYSNIMETINKTFDKYYITGQVEEINIENKTILITIENKPKLADENKFNYSGFLQYLYKENLQLVEINTTKKTNHTQLLLEIK